MRRRITRQEPSEISFGQILLAGPLKNMSLVEVVLNKCLFRMYWAGQLKEGDKKILQDNVHGLISETSRLAKMMRPDVVDIRVCERLHDPMPFQANYRREERAPRKSSG